MKTYYFIDFENLHEEAFKVAKSATENDVIYIFYTANSHKIDLDAFDGQQGKIMVIKAKAGKQSLDMCLVSYLGYLIKADGNNSRYIIVSEDSDFDNVITMWKGMNITTVSRKGKAAEKAVINTVPKEQNNEVIDPLYEKIEKILTGNKLSKEVSDFIAPLVVDNVKTKNGKQTIYRAIIQKYGQKKGLAYYNLIKKDIKAIS